MNTWPSSKRVLLILFCVTYLVATAGIYYFHRSAPEEVLPLPNPTSVRRSAIPVAKVAENPGSVASQPAAEAPAVVPLGETEKQKESVHELAESMEPDGYYQVKNKEGLCLALSKMYSEHKCPLLHFEPCKEGARFAWQYSDGQLALMDNCLDIFREQNNLHACPCHGGENQKWSVGADVIRSEFGSRLCVATSAPVGPEKCPKNGERQWFFEKVKDTWSQPLDAASQYPGFPKSGIEVNGRITYADQQSMEKVKEMMLHAWNGYVSFAWGHDELRPVSNTHRDWIGTGMAATIIDSLDTLYIMGLTDEYQAARQYVAENLSFNMPSTVSFFETVIRALGGLLAAYGLTNDKMYVDKARDLGDRLLAAFNSPSGLPYGVVNLQNGQAHNHHWAGGSHILAEVGTIQLEFKYLSEVTGDRKYAEAVNRVMEIMKGLDSFDPGLYPVYIPANLGNWKGNQDYSMGGLGDSYYEYLLKQWLQTGKTETRFKKWYDESSQGIKKRMLGQTVVKGETYQYLGKYKSGYLEPKMEHLACFAGGMFALGAAEKATSTVEVDFKLGAELTKTCRASYAHSPSHLGTEKFQFGRKVEADPSGKYYILRPEYVESLFVMWRLTKDPIYREWGWDVIVALETHSRTPTGFSGLDDTTMAHPKKNDNQESFFLAETLKYLYLLYTDDDVIPLDKFVFNTEAHPLPVFVPKVFKFLDSE